MSTMIYKATERYDFGWTDPRATLGNIKVNQRRHTGLEEVSTEVLRNLWFARFGELYVDAKLMHDTRAEDIADVVQELANRGYVRQEMIRSLHKDTFTSRYRLLEEQNADR